MLIEKTTNNYEIVENELTLINSDYFQLDVFIKNEAEKLNVNIVSITFINKFDSRIKYDFIPRSKDGFKIKYTFDFTNINKYKFFTYLVLKRLEQIEHLNKCYEVNLCA